MCNNVTKENIQTGRQFLHYVIPYKIGKKLAVKFYGAVSEGEENGTVIHSFPPHVKKRECQFPNLV